MSCCEYMCGNTLTTPPAHAPSLPPIYPTSTVSPLPGCSARAGIFIPYCVIFQGGKCKSIPRFGNKPKRYVSAGPPSLDLSPGGNTNPKLIYRLGQSTSRVFPLGTNNPTSIPRLESNPSNRKSIPRLVYLSVGATNPQSIPQSGTKTQNLSIGWSSKRNLTLLFGRGQQPKISPLLKNNPENHPLVETNLATPLLP